MAVVISDQLLDRSSDRLLDAEPDEHLVGLAQTGHEAAFAAIVRRYERELLTQARRLTSDGRGEDAVQQALLNALTALRAGAEVRHLRGWLHQILRNVVTRARLPADAPLAVELADVSSLEETVQRRAQAHATLVQLSALPERQRDALVGTAVHGLPRAHLAQAMGLSEGAVRQLVHRARRRLRQTATALLPLPLAKLLGAARSGAVAASDAAIGATTAASGGLAIKVGTLLASGVVATGLAVTQTFPGHHRHTGSLTGTRHHAARAPVAGRLTEAPAFRAVTSVVVPASLIVAPDRVSARHGGGSGGPARLHGSGSGRGGPGPGRGHDSGARGGQGSGQSGHGDDGGTRGATGDDGGSSGSGSTSGSGRSGADSGATSSPGSGAGHDSSGSGGDGGGSGDASSLSSTGADGARVGTDTSSGSSGSGSDGSVGSAMPSGSDSSGGGSDGSGGGSGTSGGTTTSAQSVTQPSSGDGTTSGSDGGHKDSAASRDLSGSLDSSSS